MSAEIRPTVLIVDDEVDIRLLIRAILETADLGVTVVGEAVDGIDAMQVFNSLDLPDVPDVVILDNRMPGKNGLEVAAEMLDQEPGQHIVLFSAFVTPDIQDQADALGVRACVGKHDFASLPQLIVQLSR